MPSAGSMVTQVGRVPVVKLPAPAMLESEPLAVSMAKRTDRAAVEVGGVEVLAARVDGDGDREEPGSRKGSKPAG